MKRILLFSWLLYLPFGLAHAAPPAATESASATGYLLRFTGALLLVLAIPVLLAWASKRLGIQRALQNTSIKTVGSVRVGSREQVSVIEVGDQWFVIGVAPGCVQAIGNLPKPADASGVVAPPQPAFASTLRAFIKKQTDKPNAS